MLRLISGLLLLASCSMGTVKTGGEGRYTYDPKKEYTSEELMRLAPEVVEVSKREPPVGKLDDLVGKDQLPLKRIGIVIFESEIQPTRSGLATPNQIFLSEAGKQLLTEKLLNVWEQIFTTFGSKLDYVPVKKIKKAKSFSQSGMNVDDAIKSKRDSLEPDDIFYLEKGKHTTTATVLNPRGMRDLSLLLVPATELMMGPKWSEQHKHFVNDVAKELKLDAVLIVMSKLSWTAAHIDKHSGESIPEGVKVELESSTLMPLSEYRKRAEKLKLRDVPSVNLAYRAYEAQVLFPARITVPGEEQNFETIMNELLRPMLKTYIDLSVMMIHQISEDLRKTHK